MEDPVSPFTTMENSLVFRSRLESSETSNKAPRATISICLFGVPDPKLSSELVRQVELRNATTFGKLFNFDVVRGEPIPPEKKPRLKQNVEEDKYDVENFEEYNWEEKYDDDYVTRCNKHTFSSTPTGVDPPKRHSISLFVAPNILGPSSNEQSPTSTPALSTSSSSSVKSEPLETKKPVSRHTCHLHHHFKSVRKPCPPMVQQIITKYTYTNRVLRQAMRKPRHSLSSGKSGHPRLRVCRC